MRSKLFGTRKRKATAAVLLLLLVSSSAFAVWTVMTASGVGNARVATLQSPTIVAGETVSAGDIWPGGFPTNPGGKLRIKVTNPNSTPVTLTGLSVSVASATSVAQAGCAANAVVPFLWVASPYTGLSVSIPANATNYEAQVPGTIGLDPATPSACQGAVVNNILITNAQFEASFS